MPQFVNRENLLLLPNDENHNCFGCSPKNASGLKMEFYTNEEKDSVFSWFSALLVPWFIFGANYDFAKDVYRLYSNCDFRISITLMFLMLPASRFLTRTINRAVTSSRNRKILFITISIVAVSSFVSIFNYLESVYNPRAYIFSFCVLSIIYFILIIHRSVVNEPRKQQRQNPFETSSFNF